MARRLSRVKIPSVSDFNQPSGLFVIFGFLYGQHNFYTLSVPPQVLQKNANEIAMKLALIIMALLCPALAAAETNVIRIYQDADLSNNSESSEAIQKGMELAFDEINNEIAGYTVEFKYLDHRGNVVRSKRNYQTFIDDSEALAIYSGLHSPPLMKNRKFINQNKALTMVPWAAGGSITRYPSNINWIFRLSLDDTRAGPVIIDYALNRQGCLNPHLLLEDTAWGDSNFESMSNALRKGGFEDISVSRFSWSVQKIGALKILRHIADIGNDCIVLVSNSPEAGIILGEMARLPPESRLPVISHWGIVGGNFPDVVTVNDRKGFDLHFIQTCFAFTNAHQSEFAQQVFTRLKKYSNGAIDEPGDLKSAVGFVHAYDLTKILIQAIRQTGLTGDIAYDRNAVRIALENIRDPVVGLVKIYNSPFSVFDADTNFNAHEALDEYSYCMGTYGQDNEVLIVQGRSK